MGLFTKGLTLPKRLSRPSLTPVEVPLPEKVILPLKPYTGTPAQPLVSVGEKVKRGQLIAEGTGSVPVHATIAGTVAAIAPHLDPRGTEVASVTIESDGTDDAIVPSPREKADTADAILAAIHDAGLMVRAITPVAVATDLVPLDQPKTHLYRDGRAVVKRTDTLIVNALDPEPSLGVNRYLAGIHNDVLVPGIAALKTVTGAHRTIFTTDTASPCPQLAQIVADDEEEMTSLIALNNRHFPIALPPVLIKTVLSKELPLPYGHPRDIGVALYDIDTVVAVGEAVAHHTPQTTSLLTIGGDGIAQHGIAQVRIGTPIGEIIAALGGLAEGTKKIILGGPLTGMAHYELTTPVTKDITALFALTDEQIQTTEGYAECINCGMCVKVCPVNLVPGMLSMYCAKGLIEQADREGLLCCIECGCCDYVCPSRRPLVHLFRHAKHQLMEA